MKRRRLRRLAAAVTALLVLAMLWWGNNSLSTEEYTYTSERLPDGWDGARIGRADRPARQAVRYR